MEVIGRPKCPYCEEKENDAKGYTWAEYCKTREQLASDPELRRKVESEVNETLSDGHSFKIDEFGFGHFISPIYVSRGDNE